uniref:Uncharacterized protein n=1 Tax=Oxyrrhis marina TaxID=2969 RepID=A0A7S3UK76_OXYMA
MVSEDPDAGGNEIVALFHGEDGDPTDGVASQHAGLFVNHKVQQWELDVGGESLLFQQTPGDLRHAGVTGCVVWNGAVVLAAALEKFQEEGLLDWSETAFKAITNCSVTGSL